MAELSYRDAGTICHALTEKALREGKPCAEYVGQVLTVPPSKHFTLGPSSAARWLRCPASVALAQALPPEPAEEPVVGTITLDMAESCQLCVDWINAQPGTKFYEVDVPIDHMTGEEGATGRSDCIITDGDLLTVIDWKFGYGRVEAEKNPQLAMYANGADREFSWAGEFNRFRFVIHQPAISPEPLVWECTREQLDAFGLNATRGAERVADAIRIYATEELPAEFFAPSDEACKYCRVGEALQCPARQNQMQATIGVDFDDLTAADKIKAATNTVADSPQLANYYELVPLIESWCDAVNKAMFHAVESGNQSAYKLVAGKKGNRAWSDKAAAEALMKSMRAKHAEMYDYSIISPTVAEKRTKQWADADGEIHEPTFGERQWPKLKSLITQSEGKPTIAKATDSRPALQAKFEALTGAEDLV